MREGMVMKINNKPKKDPKLIELDPYKNEDPFYSFYKLQKELNKVLVASNEQLKELCDILEARITILEKELKES
jgi:hypothetical protein